MRRIPVRSAGAAEMKTFAITASLLLAAKTRAIVVTCLEMTAERIRPKCRRCGAPLDLWMMDPDTGRPYLFCNYPKIIDSDEQFWGKVSQLDGDEVARLGLQ
jgi:hypothetical protein